MFDPDEGVMSVVAIVLKQKVEIYILSLGVATRKVAAATKMAVTSSESAPQS